MKINICTWNLNGLGIPELSGISLSNVNLPDIVCLQNASLPPKGETQDYKWLCLGTFGSAILIKKNSDIEASGFQQLSDNLCAVEVRVKNVKAKVISCYIPPLGVNDALNEESWSKLTVILKSLTTECIIGGNFSAEIGLEEQSELDTGVIGKRLLHKNSNENGRKLRNLVREVHFKILNSFGVSDELHTYQNGEVKRQEDFIIFSNGYGELSSLKETEVFIKKHPQYSNCIVGSQIEIKDLVEESDFNSVSGIKYTISTWNAEGFSMTAIDKVLSDKKLSLVCIQGLESSSENSVTNNTDNYVWFKSGGVGILISKCLSITMNNFKSVSDCLCVGDVVFYGSDIKVVSCYLPLVSDPKHESVVAQLTELVKSFPQGTDYVVSGDFNCKKLTDEEMTSEEIKSDWNRFFLQKLALETALAVRCDEKLITRVSKSTGIGNPHNILISENCFTKVADVQQAIQWIPFCENALLYFRFVTVKSEPSTKFNQDDKNSLLISEETENTDEVTLLSKMEYFENSPLCKKEDYCQNVKPLSQMDLHRFKKSPAPPNEFYRMLGDFVLFHKPTEYSCVDNKVFSVLSNSFYLNKLGPLLQERVELVDRKTHKLKKVFFNIAWNEIIILHQECSKNVNNRKLKRRAAMSLLNILGQQFYTVVAKRSYFNKGFPPVLKIKGDPGIDLVFKVLDRKMFLNNEELLNYIDNFFSEETESELAFGSSTGFTESDLNEVIRHAKSHNLGHRFYMTSSSENVWDHIALFMNLTPQHIRDRLIKNPFNYKYYLIPPSGIGQDYNKYFQRCHGTFEIIKNENKIIQELTDPCGPKKSNKDDDFDSDTDSVLDMHVGVRGPSSGATFKWIRNRKHTVLVASGSSVSSQKRNFSWVKDNIQGDAGPPKKQSRVEEPLPSVEKQNYKAI